MSGDAEKSPSQPESRLRADSLLVGVAAILFVTVFQRGIGFARNLLLCRYLDDTELGRWSLALSALMFLAPLVVLGLPGTFGRYVEAFRREGQLRRFIWQTAAICLAVGMTAALALWLFRGHASYLLFNDATYGDLVAVVAGALLVVAAANFVSELLMALCLGRLLSVLQLASSFTFAAVALGGVAWFDGGAEAVVWGYASGSAVVALVGGYVLARYGRTMFEEAVQRRPRRIWRAIVPFAWWMWVTNLVANLYESIDRLMLVHWAPSSGTPEALVGQYHAALVVPAMLVAVAGMLAGVLLPYLSADWEEGDGERLAERMNQTVRWGAVGLTAAGIAVLAGSGWLFDGLLRGKYDQGLAILPWTLAYAAWFGLMLLVQNYLWCAEKAGRIAAALVAGLVVNVAVNAWSIPRWGVQGAVLATSLSVVTCLVISFWLATRAGMRWDRASTWIWGLPASLLGGPVAASAVLLAALWCLYRRGALAEAIEMAGRCRSLVAARLGLDSPQRPL